MNYKNFINNKFKNYPRWWEFLKYCIVGGTGTIIDVGIYTLLTRVVLLYYIFSATISFLIAVINNFLLNKYWTFKKGESGQTKKEYTKFLIVSTINYFLNIGIMFLIVEYSGLDIIFGHNVDFFAKFIAIIIVTISNYLGNRYWTFKY